MGKAAEMGMAEQELADKIAEKEGLSFPLTRFELKLQKPFFFKEDFQFERIEKAIKSYTVMYFTNMNEKNMIIDKYNSYFIMSNAIFNHSNLLGLC